MKVFIVLIQFYKAGPELEHSRIDAIQALNEEEACKQVADMYAVDNYDSYEISAVALDQTQSHQSLFRDDEPA